MTRDGQTHRDYGTHGLPASDWKLYDTCNRCSAESGQPCLDLRVRHVPHKLCWVAHPNRPLVSVLDGAGVLANAGLIKTSLEGRVQLCTRRNSTVDLEARRALNWTSHPSQARTGRARWNVKAPCRSNGHLITVAETHHPYGRSTNKSSYLTHILVGILFAWQDGKFRMAQARWRCGSRTHDFVLLDEPNSTVCPACKIERIPAEQRQEERYR